MIVGACGFSWSGSSAIVDYLKEFEGFDVYDKIEFGLAYHPDGLSDLDYNLNMNCAKFLSSGVAIPRFKKVAYLLLKNPTQGKIVQLTEKYVNDLTQVKWYGINGPREHLMGHKWFYRTIVERLIGRRIYSKIPENIVKLLNLYPLKQQYFSVCPENFIKITQDYVYSILDSMGIDTSKNIVLNQPFPGNCPVRSMSYFKNSKAIIVDRDPRDLYLLAKEYYPTRTYQTPHDNVNDFIKFFYNMHKKLNEEVQNNNVLRVQFEELVYEYDATQEKIMQFLGLSKRQHIHVKRFFKPELSVANTRLFEKCKKYKEDIVIIENKLSEYLFDFSKYKIDNTGRMFDEMWEIEKEH